MEYENPAGNEQQKDRFLALRVIAALSVLALTTLALLLVFDFLTMESFQALLVKVLLVCGILTAASVVLGMLSSRSS